MAEVYRITMERPHLRQIPEYQLPEGYELRPYRTGDNFTWLRIHHAADAYTGLSDALFEKQFGTDEQVIAARQFYLDFRGLSIGTASAWFCPGEPEVGRVHWVAIDPEFHRRGLSKPLVTAVLGRMRELGHSRATLDTDSRRPVAIALYEKFGFSITRREPME